MISHPTQEVKISTADPSAIGLFGLAIGDTGRVVSETMVNQRRFVRPALGRFPGRIRP